MSGAGRQLSDLQNQVAQKLFSDPNYVLTPDDYSIYFARPYNGEDLSSLSSGLKQQNQQSIASNEFMGTYGGFIPIAAAGAAALGAGALGGAGAASGAGGVADIGVGGAAANSVGTGLAGGAAAAGGTTGVGGGMWDWLTNLLGGGGSEVGGSGFMGSGFGAADSALGELGINTALPAGTPGGIAAGTSVGDLAGSYGIPGLNAVNTALQGTGASLTPGNLFSGPGFSVPSGTTDIAKLLLGDKGLAGLLGSGGLLGLAGSTVPGMLALNYANSQPAVDTSQLQSVYSQAGENTPGFVQAAIDPFQQNIAAGYGDLLQSQAQRGIRGSSFGDTDIANFLSTTGRALSGAGSTAQQQALGLQGNLAGQIASLNAQNQQIKNQLYGRAFDIFGRGLSPSPYAWVGSTGSA